jgi:signal transduction histidine kinase
VFKKLIDHILYLGVSDTDNPYQKEKIRLINIFWSVGGLMFIIGAALSYFDNKPEPILQLPFRAGLIFLVYFFMRKRKIQWAMYFFIISFYLTSLYTAYVIPHQGMFHLIGIVLIAVSYYVIENRVWNVFFLFLNIATFLFIRQYQIEHQVPIFDLSYSVSIAFVFLAIYLILVLYKMEQSRLNQLLEDQNEKLVMTDNVKNNLLSILSHDLRSPLVSITSLLTLILEEDEIKNSELFEMFDSIKNRSDLTLHLMDQILNWAHTQVDGFQLNPHNITVKNIFTEEMMLLETQIDDKNAKIINTIPDDVMAYADLQIFKTVIRNMISNALKYVREGDEIIFQADQINNGTQITVRDNGIGIDEQRLATIFRQKIDAEPGTKNEMGSGLGLLISSDFVRMHGGDITIDSVKDEGTVVKTFWPNKK